MKPVDYAILAKRAYTDAPTVGRADSASRMHVYEVDGFGPVHVFRGSDDAESWLHDFDIETVEVQGLGKVHAGFYSAVQAILPECLALPPPAAIAGHSLGAAMAILYGAILTQLGHMAPVFAFEPPRVAADDGLHQFYAATGIPWYACRNGRDLVTQVPPAMTLPGPLTEVGKAVLPFDNIEDHAIGRVVAALAEG